MTKEERKTKKSFEEVVRKEEERETKKLFEEVVRNVVSDAINTYRRKLANLIEEAYKDGRLTTIEQVIELLRCN